MGLSDGRFKRGSTDVVGRSFENLIQFSKRFAKAAIGAVEKCVLTKHGSVAGVECLSIVKESFAPIPLSLPASDIGERHGNLTAIRQERAGLLKIANRRVVIL